MPEFSIDLSLVKKSDVIPPLIHKKVIKKAKTRLQAIINKIERATQLRFLPRIKVVPFALVNGPVVNLGIIATSAIEDHLEPVIFISAPTILFADEGTLTSHILNLFMRYIVMSIIMYYGLMIKPHEYIALQKDTEFWASMAKLVIKDERILEAFHEYITNPMAIKTVINEIAQKWLNEGYPAGWVDSLVEIRFDLPVIVDLDLVEKMGWEIALMIIEWLRRFRVGELSI